MSELRFARALRALTLALGLGVAFAPGAAQAQLFGGWGGWDDGGAWDGLGPQQVRRAIADRGFRVVAPLRRNGNVYVADVVDPSGQRERLIVAAADASILSRFLIDDGRAPFRGAPSRAFGARGADEGAPVPPADIPDINRRASRPAEAPAQRFGDFGADDGPEVVPQPQPPLRAARPRPRVVERSPEPPATARVPGPVEATPLAPVPSRPTPTTAPPAASVPPAAAKAPAVVRIDPAPAPVAAPSPAPATPAPPAVARRPSDPLAIPGSGEPRTVRSVASGITGAPQPAPAPPAPASPPAQPAAPAKAPAQPAVVPVAPLD